MKQLSLLTEAESSGVDSLVPESTSGSIASADTHENHQYLLNFDQIVGQTLAISLLTSAIASNRIAPAYLFTGVEGVGKTLAAQIFAAQLLASKTIINHPDLLWVEPTYLHQGNLLTISQLEASGATRTSKPSIRVEQIREITQFLSQSALTASRKVELITDANQINATAANALLKTLEEPNGNNCIVLLSSKSLLPTITSRCSVIPFRPLCPTSLKLVLESLGRTDVLLRPPVLAMAAGSPGLAISNYEKWKEMPQKLLALTPPEMNGSILEALQVNKTIKILEIEQQKWLLDFFQHQWWQQYQDGLLVAKVEAAKSALNKSASPRLVWDVLLMPLNN